MKTDSVNTRSFYLKNPIFTPNNIFDAILVGKIYAEQNCDEWYDMLYRLSPEEIKLQCRFFHLEIILNCELLTQRYARLLHEKLAPLN